jgi:hypothetical protein
LYLSRGKCSSSSIRSHMSGGGIYGQPYDCSEVLCERRCECLDSLLVWWNGGAHIRTSDLLICAENLNHCATSFPQCEALDDTNLTFEVLVYQIINYSCLLYSNVCKNKYYKFILNYYDLFRC